MIASVVCPCGRASVHVAHATHDGRPVALFAARLVATAAGWATSPCAVGDHPAEGVCPVCRQRSIDAVYHEEMR